MFFSSLGVRVLIICDTKCLSSRCRHVTGNVSLAFHVVLLKRCTHIDIIIGFWFNGMRVVILKLSGLFQNFLVKIYELFGILVYLI